MKSKCVFTRFICGVLSIAAVIAVSSCDPDIKPIDPGTDNATGLLDGLWVEQVGAGATIVPHVDIRGTKAVLCKSNPFEYDYTQRVDGNLHYDSASRKGRISFSDGSNLEFVCDEQGIFCSRDTIPYYKIDNTLDKLQELNVSPRLALCKDYVGPDHDLSIDLSVNKLLGGAELNSGSAWYVDILKFAGESVAKGALSWIGGHTMEAIFECFFSDPTSEKLESILSQVGEINAKLSEIEQMIKMLNYEEYLNQRTNDYCNPLANYSKRYADAILAVDQNDSLAIANIVNHWHDDSPTISGRLGGPMEAASNYMDFLMSTRVEQTNLYAIYDIYTFNCVPWAHMGYDFRQSLRACDLSLITTNVYMAILYAKIHNWAENPIYKTYVTDLNKKMQDFIGYCDDNPVDITDKLVCQIKGAHFVMEKELINRDYNLREGGMTWYWPGCQFIHGDNQTSDLIIYGGMNMSIEQFRQKQIRPDEYNAISNYYDPSLNFIDILKSAGITCPNNIYQYFLLLNGGTSSDYDGNIYYNHAQLTYTGDSRKASYSSYMQAKTHWSISFRYWFDGWEQPDWASLAIHHAADVLYRY